jgi:hypothetical protein
MTRPAIIIGLGGTGQRIVTYLKKELLEIGNGELPKDVKLFAFDTVSHTAHMYAGDEGGVFHLGDVSLEEKTEYVCIGSGGLFNTVLAIAADQEREAAGQNARNPHLLWFPAKEMLERSLPRVVYNTRNGAGAYRPLGRLSLFVNVPTVLAHLENAMTDLQGGVQGTTGAAGGGRTRLLEIIVVGSLAGGTGAGTFIDMAWLVRAQANTFLRDQYALRGFFLLPTAFVGAGSEDKQGRGFAAWQELDRAMLSGGSGNTIVYDPADPNLHIKCDIPAYDITYMIDPGRPVHPVQPPPEDGIFPGVAHLLSFLLDEDSGPAYTENLITTIVDRRSHLPKGVYHSSIGGYTLKVPVYYNRAKFSHELARKTLDILLMPQMDNKGNINEISNLGNAEAAGAVGMPAAVSFLGADKVGTIPNTGLLQLIARHRTEKAQEDGKLIGVTAGGTLRTSLLNYFNGFNQVTSYNPATGQTESHSLSDELSWTLWKECPPRAKAEAPEGAHRRLTLVGKPKSVPAVRTRRFGVDDANHPDRGEFGNDLVASQKAQVKRFKELLAEQVRQDLNGSSSNPLVARAGKLGYVRSLVYEVKESLAYFRRYLKDVDDVRSSKRNLSHETRDAASRAKHKYAREYNKHYWLTFWDGNVHPKADRACRNWLQAEMFDIDRQRGDILLQVLDETVAEMEEYAKKTMMELESWIAHLATGDPSLEIEGLYRWVLKSHGEVEINHQLDKRQGNPNFHADQQFFGVMQVLPEDESEPTDEMLKDVLGRLTWRTGQGRDGLQIDFDLEFDGADPQAPKKVESLRREGEKPVRYNLKQLIRLTEKHYAAVAMASSIAQEIAGTYPTGQGLATSLDNRAEPYYRLKGNEVPPAVRQAYLRVDDTASAAMQNYFDIEFKGQYLQATPLIGLGGYQKVHSEDRYKLTLVRSDDLMPSQSFQQWHTCFPPYQQLFGSISEKEVHIFPHEQNAAYYQQRIPDVLGQEFRSLRPEVVALLGDQRKFKLFFKAFAHGLVAKQQVDQNGIAVTFWGYHLAEHSVPLYLTDVRADGDKFGIFELIRNFLNGIDVRVGYDQTSEIDWAKLWDDVSKLERQMGLEKRRDLYETQTQNNSGTLLNEILNERDRDLLQAQHDHAAHTLQATAANQKYTDLADLARYIFKTAALGLGSS